jgi:beta-phosphoglucomutase-like phosphatase (HAD superfamily)
MPRGVILDADGTLLLSNDAHARAGAQACAEYGYGVPFERVRPLIGVGGDRLIATVAPGLDVRHDPSAAIAARRQEIVLARYDDSPLAASGRLSGTGSAG